MVKLAMSVGKGINEMLIFLGQLFQNVQIVRYILQYAYSSTAMCKVHGLLMQTNYCRLFYNLLGINLQSCIYVPSRYEVWIPLLNKIWVHQIIYTVCYRDLSNCAMGFITSYMVGCHIGSNGQEGDQVPRSDRIPRYIFWPGPGGGVSGWS